MKWWKPTLAVLGVLLLAVGGAAAWLFSPVAAVELPKPVEANARVYDALAEAGVEKALVDVTPERALVRYDLPDGADRNETLWTVLALAATGASSSDVTVAQEYVAGVPKREVYAATRDILAYLAGDMTADELAAVMTENELR